MIAEAGAALSRWAERWVPDPFVLAIGLTLAVSLLALPRLQWSPVELARVWVDGSGTGRGVWSLLAFSMQMCLILVTGYALAQSPPVARGIAALARLPRTPRASVAMVALMAMLAALLNWGLGLIVGALMAREVGRLSRANKTVVHYPLLVAAGYSGLMVWHGGLSGSAPLKVTTMTQLQEVLGEDLAARVGAMPLEQTVLSATNAAVTIACLVGVPLLLMAMTPSEAVEAPATLVEAEEAPVEARPDSPARWLERSRLVVAIPVLLSGTWLVHWLYTVGLSRLDPNVVNLFMLTAGLALHGSVSAYVAAVQRAVGSCAGILLQYPFYAGIMGIMAGSGLIATVAGSLSGLGPTALTVATFYLAGLVNLFVPSGGGQWAVQGPIVMEAALSAGADPSRVLMALAYGDQWTNMVQPFWALPLLGICRIRASRIIGYTALLMLVSQLFFLIPLVVA